MSHRCWQRGEGEINDLYLTIEPALSFRLTPRLSLEVALVLEPVFDPEGKSRYFDDEGLYAEQIYLEYATEQWGVRGGKLNPYFGIAWDRAGGIYGVDLGEDYELTERVGVGGFLRLGNDQLGFHRLAADVFSLDTSWLSGSVLNDRGRVRRSDGGSSNTWDPSFEISLESEELPILEGLGYHLGFTRQESGKDGIDEYGYAVALTYGFALTESIDVELLSEYVYRRHVEGEAENFDYLTESAVLRWEQWNLAVVGALRDRHGHGNGSESDYLFQVSVGYELAMGLGIDVGWLYTRDDGVDSHGLGVLVAYTLEF